MLFLAPSVLLWLFWFLYPALKSMRLSFYDYSFINPERQKFVGLDNYIRLFQDSAFLDALKHTFILAFVVVAFISVLAFIIAVLLEGNIRGKTFFRTVCFMPYIISSVAVSIFFRYFFVKADLVHACLCFWCRRYNMVYRIRTTASVFCSYYIYLATTRVLYDSIYRRITEHI